MAECLKFIAQEVLRRGGMSYATEGTVNVPLLPGDTVALCRINKSGAAEVLLPVKLTRAVGFGRYHIAIAMVKHETPELKSVP
jgi:hypothetical protein